MAAVTIRAALSSEDFNQARQMIVEYAEELGVEFCLLGFEQELASLDTMYGPSGGLLLMALDGNELVGCIAYRALAEGVCEMKRTYVVPAARGRSIGRSLTQELVARARDAGYRRMVLDTMPKLEAACALYRSLGFEDTSRYNDNPIPGVVYMSLDL
jgi:ribosomal protein S18 acetylase RimI-like enzyme